MTLPVYSRQADAILFASSEVPSHDEAEEFVGGIIELDEWTAYYIKFFSGVPHGFVNGPVKPLPGGIFELNFRNFVGYSRLFDLDIRVRSRKITEGDYTWMLNDVSERCAALIYSFDTPTGVGGSKGDVGNDPLYVQFMFVKRHLLNRSPDIDGIMAAILSNFHHRFETRSDCQPVGSIRDPKPSDITRSLSGSKLLRPIATGHVLTTTSLGKRLKFAAGRPLFLHSCFETRTFTTHDTMENRFVRHVLVQVSSLLGRLAAEIPSSGTWLDPEMRSEVLKLRIRIDKHLSHPLWQSVGELDRVPQTSSVLQRQTGYSDLFQLFALLRLSTRFQLLDNDIREIIESKNLPLLYEYWCFFVVLDVIEQSVGPYIGADEIDSVSTLESWIRPGIAIKFPDDVVLYFNLSCNTGETAKHHSYSHRFVPDIVIDRRGNKLILDAKAKGERGSFWGEESDGRITRYKDEDVDKMHTYRDAISGVEGAYILYPGEQTIFFASPEGTSSQDGVGAIALRPGESEIGKKSIAEVLAGFLSAE